ncbi:MAG: hypothetical protein A3K19_31570 [Lentisphaerae bacterium RIFOXYB12_FULL_65_16]|nr:MAG: hypothetical protein A3K19_31570 [Lentisphaerae bacterium RIFOXYB12_FULL_65_16]
MRQEPTCSGDTTVGGQWRGTAGIAAGCSGPSRPEALGRGPARAPRFGPRRSEPRFGHFGAGRAESRRAWLGLASVWLGLAVAALAPAQETPRLSLVQVQALCGGDVEATGRLLPQFSALVGSRLAAHIAEWGKNDAGQWLDAGMPVKAGQVLFSLDQGTLKASLDRAQAMQASSEAALADLVAPPRRERVDILKASVDELAARLTDRQHDEERYRRLVEDDKTMPVKRLEEARLEATALRSQLVAAQARLDEAVTGPTRTQIAIAEARVAEARAAVAAAALDLRDAEVKAPFDGVITRRMKGLGDYVAGAPFVDVLELVTLDRLEAELRLAEAYLPQVIPGQTKVRLSCPLAPSEQELIVTRVVPQIDPASGTFVFRVAIPPDQATGLVPGAFVTARLAFGQGDAAVLVPLRALSSQGGSNGVFVADNGKMVRRPVEIGSRLTEGVVVRGDLKPGDSVLVGAPEQLTDGAALPEYLMEKE